MEAVRQVHGGGELNALGEMRRRESGWMGRFMGQVEWARRYGGQG